MGVGLSQDVAVAVLVEGVLKGVAVRGQTLGSEERVTGGGREFQNIIHFGPITFHFVKFIGLEGPSSFTTAILSL